MRAYFATVETQKRGSLHFHCIVWVEGVTPDSVQAYIQDPENRQQFKNWLESVISECIPTSTSIRTEPPACYACPDPDAADFEANFQGYLADVVMASNIHTHKLTCYKYRKPGEPLKCRMDYGRVEHLETIIDPTSGGILVINFYFFLFFHYFYFIFEI